MELVTQAIEVRCSGRHQVDAKGAVKVEVDQTLGVSEEFTLDGVFGAWHPLNLTL